jgi:hypothetical protein
VVHAALAERHPDARFLQRWRVAARPSLDPAWPRA